MSYIGKWQNWYTGTLEPQSYGAPLTYEIAAKWLGGIDVEDWGVGKGYFQSIYPGNVVGVDGTKTKFSDVVADLTEYTSSTPGLFMRHVIEHNLEWKKVLQNAADSFTEKMVLVLFTPMAKKTQQIAWNDGVEVPDMSFAQRDIVKYFKDCDIKWKDHKTATQYGTERVFLIERKQ